MTSNPRQKKAGRITLIIAIMFAIAGTAHALSSGMNWFGDVQTYYGCRGVYLQAGVENPTSPSGGLVPGWGTIRLAECVPNGRDLTLPTGAFQVAVDGYRNGGWCGGTGWVGAGSVPSASSITAYSLVCPNFSTKDRYWYDSSGHVQNNSNCNTNFCNWTTLLAQHSPIVWF
jgi:hypothetical protein